jgi:uncharacterized protein (DUF2267 family)
MAEDNVSVIEHAAQDCHEWVNELTDALDWQSRRDALRLLRAVLTSIRDRVSHDEAAHFAAQLPLLIRGMFYEGWRPAHTPLKDRSKEAFMQEIDSRFDSDSDYRGTVDIAEVYALLKRRVSEGELQNVLGGLPKQIRAILLT